MAYQSIFLKTMAAASQSLAESAYLSAREDRDAFIAGRDQQSLYWFAEMARCGREHSSKARLSLGVTDADQIYS
jgi:hypothetical protein